jgi:hypothetical protein
MRIFPAEPGLPAQWGDRIVEVDGRSPIILHSRLDASAAPVRYEVERAGARATFEIAPQPFTWRVLLNHFGTFFAVSGVMLAVGIGVFVQNPRARPNRNFLFYMCLWAVSNVAVPESVLGSSRIAASLVGFISIVLSVHGWVFFLTYPVNPPREAWLERHRVIPRLYAGAHAHRWRHRSRAPRRHQDRRAGGDALDLYCLRHDHQHRRSPGRSGGRRGDRRPVPLYRLR